MKAKDLSKPQWWALACIAASGGTDTKSEATVRSLIRRKLVARLEDGRLLATWSGCWKLLGRTDIITSDSLARARARWNKHVAAGGAA
jgi:hypothetical protein